jgi:ABC-type nickel/cobalt efflux system permease component RcnA
MMRRALLAAAGAVLTATVLLIPARPAAAHPLGNLTVNTYAGIVVRGDALTVDYVVDLAELPTVQVLQRIDRDGDGKLGPSESAAYRESECTRLLAGLEVSLGGRSVPLTPGAGSVRLLPGQGGLQTLRLECPLRGDAALGDGAELAFRDGNFMDRIGWREITLAGDGTTVGDTDIPARSVSDRLLAYPADGRSPLRQLELNATVEPGGPPLDRATTGASPPAAGAQGVAQAPQARGADPLTSWFQRTVGDRELTVGLASVALVVALVLGGLHAIAPGHGKTLMAAYVVGRRGTTREVVAIGLTVAATHTGGVLALGSVIWLSQAVAPDRVLPWLTVASGVLLATCGLGLLYRRVVLGRTGHSHLRLPGLPDHNHDHEHEHEHHDHGHGHDHRHGDDHGHHHDHEHPHDHDHDHGPGHEPPPLRKAWLVLMGVAGGLVPTPSALVVLLGAVALHRTWFGVVLVGLYGLGMAAALMGAGLLLVRLQRWLERHWYHRPRAVLALRYLPAVTALALVGGGLSIVLRGWTQL